MSQFLIACGGPAEERAGLATRAIGLAADLWRGDPAQRVEDGPLTVLRFQAGSHEQDDALLAPHEWAVACGTLFVGGLPGGQVLAELLQTRGQPDWLEDVDGGFVVALGGPAPGGVQVITDRLGTLHCYRTRVGGCSVVSTSSLLLALLARPEWDVRGVRQFLAYGNVFEGRTLFEGIEKLRPARITHWSEDLGWGERLYWDVRSTYWDRARCRGGAAELAEALHDTMSRVAGRMPKVVLDLTGGFDSRAVLGAALCARMRPDTVVVGTPGEGDVVSSRLIAAEYGLHHEVLEPGFASAAEWWQWARRALVYTDGEFDVLLYARVLKIHEGLRGHYSASVNGSNGEIAKGYWWELLAPRVGEKHAFDARRIAAQRFAHEGDVPGLLQAHFAAGLVDEFSGIIERETAGLEDAPNTALLDHVYLALRMQRWQGRLASSTARLWPCVSPFCFRAPMEAALATPPAERLRCRLSRHLIELQDPRLARLPLAGGYPATPLRPTNFASHWRLAVEWGGRAARYASRRIGLRQAPRAAEPQDQLWGAPDFAALLDPGEMASASLYRAERLREVLSEGGRPGWAKLGRIVTLELLARRIAESR